MFLQGRASYFLSYAHSSGKSTLTYKISKYSCSVETFVKHGQEQNLHYIATALQIKSAVQKVPFLTVVL